MVTELLSIENAKLLWKNFSGEEKRFNRKGDRNFCVRLTEEEYTKYKEMGWNCKMTMPKEGFEDEEPLFYLPVAVGYKARPPKIMLITSTHQTSLSESDINILDWADIVNVDLIIRPYNYDVNGNEGTKAYVKAMYVTIQEDEFASKYNDIPLDDLEADAMLSRWQ